MPKKILVVDDEPGYIKILYDQLLKNNYEVFVALNGEEGLKMALVRKPHLILLDLLMPKMSGLQMLKALRKFLWGEKVPVFVLTNVNKSIEISESMNSRVSRYFVKSDLKLENLIEDIKIYLQRG